MSGRNYCARKDCQNFKCKTHIPKIGFLCKDCQQDFIKFFKDSVELYDEAIIEALDLFLTTPITKKENYAKPIIKEFFKQYTND